MALITGMFRSPGDHYIKGMCCSCRWGI